MGTIAALAAFIAAAVMLILSGLGFVHARRTSPATEILTGHPADGPGTTAPHNDHTNGKLGDDGLVTTLVTTATDSSNAGTA